MAKWQWSAAIICAQLFLCQVTQKKTLLFEVYSVSNSPSASWLGFPHVFLWYPEHTLCTFLLKPSVQMEIMKEISCFTTHFTFQHTSRPVFCTVQYLQLCIFRVAPATMPQIVESISVDIKSHGCHRENVGTSMCEETLGPSWQVSRCDTVSLYFGFCLLPCYQEAFLHGADEQCDQDIAF